MIVFKYFSRLTLKISVITYSKAWLMIYTAKSRYTIQQISFMTLPHIFL